MPFEIKLHETTLTLTRGDITREAIDAIVNAANSGLLGGGGVDGAIHRAGGPAILEECKKIRQAQGRCPTGQAVITSGGNLAARYVIHAVGPVWHGGNSGEPELLASAYSNCLRIAAEKGLPAIAFPSISTGAYGYPVEKAAHVALKAVQSHCLTNRLPSQVRFVLFDERTYAAYVSAAEKLHARA